MDQLYPLKFKPILKERIWGGSKLAQKFGKTGMPDKCGESWELSAVQGDISVVSNGFLKNNSLEELIEVYMGDLVGDSVYEQFGIEFPLLIKLIDANDDLSIQVHPNDDLAMERHNSFGKTEMWYVLENNPGAQLISGFNRKVSREEYIKAVNTNTLENLLNKVEVNPGDTFFIPSGRVHAIGAGIILAEIQQTSDITYRIFDYNRKDARGKTRELHTDLALDAIDYSFVNDVKILPKLEKNTPVNLARCNFFTTNRISLDSRMDMDYHILDSFVIYICTKGSFTIISNQEKTEMKAGETVLIPSLLDNFSVIPNGSCELLEVYIEQ